MASNLNYIVGVERAADMHRAAEYSRVVAASRARREPQRERAERKARTRLTLRRAPKMA
jgi:hypothetical protein